MDERMLRILGGAAFGVFAAFVLFFPRARKTLASWFQKKTVVTNRRASVLLGAFVYIIFLASLFAIGLGLALLFSPK